MPLGSSSAAPVTSPGPSVRRKARGERAARPGGGWRGRGGGRRRRGGRAGGGGGAKGRGAALAGGRPAPPPAGGSLPRQDAFAPGRDIALRSSSDPPLGAKPKPG